MPRSDANKQQITPPILQRLLDANNHSLQVSFELTHLDFIADVINKNLELDETLTGTKLLETLYNDFYDIHPENSYAKELVSLANTLKNKEDYDHFYYKNKKEIDDNITIDANDWDMFYGLLFGAAGILGTVTILVSTSLIASATAPWMIVGAIALPFITSPIGNLLGASKNNKLQKKIDTIKEEKLSQLPKKYQTFKQEVRDAFTNKIETFIKGSDTDLPGLVIDETGSKKTLKFNRLPALTA